MERGADSQQPPAEHRLSALADARAAVVAQVTKFASSPVFHFCKMHYFLGAVVAYFTVFYFGCCPGDFWKLHLLQFAVLLPLQVYRWASLGSLAYLLEFCWVANAWIAIHLAVCWFLPSAVSPEHLGVLFRMLFTFAAGPLQCAVVLLHNALVPHHFDYKMSLLIHMQPAMTAFGLRWHSPDTRLFPADIQLSFVEYIVPPLTFLGVWAVLHSSFFVLHGLAMPEKGYPTTPDANLNPTGRSHSNLFTSLLGQRSDDGADTMRFLKYEALSVTANALAMLATYPLYTYGTASTGAIVIGGVFMVSVWNGAEWYDFQLKRFPGVLDKLIEAERERGGSYNSHGETTKGETTQPQAAPATAFSRNQV